MTQTVQLQQKEIDGHADGPRLLITAGVHGDEFESMAAVRRLMHEIDAASLSGHLTLVPVVNESAYARQHRFGDDELDLARTCPGKPDGTVTERTAQALTKIIGAADYYIDLHTGGTTMAVLPMSGYTLHPDPDILETQRRMARAFNLPIIWGTNPNLDGRSMSVARDAKVPAIYTEYLGSATICPKGVDDYVQGCLNVMSDLGMIDLTLPQTRVEHVVEDNRPLAGYMQIQNPSPIAGFFDAQVKLGQRVQRGDLLGTVCDVLGERIEPITSKQNGIILSLKTFPRVDQDAGVAVVLEVDGWE